MNFSTPYILLLGFYGFMAWWYHASKSSKNHTWNVIACMVVTLLFWGFRGFIFYDWMSYYPLFQEINIKDISNSNIWSIEPGFALLMIACKITFNNLRKLKIVTKDNKEYITMLLDAYLYIDVMLFIKTFINIKNKIKK